MSRNSNRRIVGLGVALALAAGSASATNGYYTHGVGTVSRAQAGAGSANPEELLVLATNPAGIAFVGDSLDAGLGFFSPMRDYKTTAIPPEMGPPGACFPGQGCVNTIGPNNLSSKNELFFVPYVGTKRSLSDVDHLALAFYGRGGMNTKWEGGTATYDPTQGQGPDGPQTFPGTFGGGTAGVDLMQGFLNLTYARRLTEQFSGGVSAIFALQRFEARGLSNFAPYTKTFNKALLAGELKMPKNLSGNGHDMSYGYGASIGFQWTPVEMFSLAAAYTTKMSMSDFGEYSDLFAEGGGFDMPSTWTVGVAFRPTDALALMFDVQEINYSDAKSVSNGIEKLYNCPFLNPASSDVEYCLGGKKGAGFGWEDMTVYKFGAAWDVSDDWTARFGYSQTDQPIPKDQMTFNILAPGVMEEHWTVGFTKTQSSGNRWNVSFMYAPEKKISGPQNFDPRQSVELSMKQYELEIGYSWKR